MDKLLFVLPADKLWARTVRRAVVIFVLAGLSVVVKDRLAFSPEWAVPLLTAVLAALDKFLREILEKPAEK